jgi:hypothetical protein
MIEHIRKRKSLAVIEQMWRSTEEECGRLEHKVDILREALIACVNGWPDAYDNAVRVLADLDGTAAE